MRLFTINKLWWLIPLFFITILCFSIFNNEIRYTHYFLIAGSVLVGAYLIMFKKELFISFSIFLIPISVSSTMGGGADMVLPSEMMTIILGFIALALGISRPVYLKKVLFHPISIVLLIDLAWLFITTLTSEDIVYSSKRVLARGLFLLVFYLFLSHWLMKKENMLKFFLLYAFGLIIPIISTEMKHSRYDFNPQTVFELCKPFFNDHTIYGACIAYVIPFVLILALKAKSFGYKKETMVLLWILFGVLVFGEIMAFSRAAWLSLIVSLLLFVFLKLRLKFYHFLGLLIIVIGLIWMYREPLYMMARENDNVSNKGEIGEHIMSVGNLQTDASNMERINRWSCAVRMFEDRPVTGFGPGTFQFVYGPYQSVYEMTHISTMAGDRGNAHSEPLTYLAESGLPGFITYVLWMLTVIGFGIRTYYRSKDQLYKNIVMAALLGFITFFVHGLVNSFIDQVKMVSLVFGSISMIVAVDILNGKKLNEEKKQIHSISHH